MKNDGVEVNQEILDNIDAAKRTKANGTEFKYEEKDIILYNLGIGAKKTDLPFVLCVPLISAAMTEQLIAK